MAENTFFRSGLSKMYDQPENDGSDPMPSSRTENLAFRESVVFESGSKVEKNEPIIKNSQTILHAY